MKEKNKWFWHEWGIPLIAANGIVWGLFFFCVALCVIFGGYRF